MNTCMCAVSYVLTGFSSRKAVYCAALMCFDIAVMVLCLESALAISNVPVVSMLAAMMGTPSHVCLECLKVNLRGHKTIQITKNVFWLASVAATCLSALHNRQYPHDMQDDAPWSGVWRDSPCERKRIREKFGIYKKTEARKRYFAYLRVMSTSERLRSVERFGRIRTSCATPQCHGVLADHNVFCGEMQICCNGCRQTRCLHVTTRLAGWIDSNNAANKRASFSPGRVRCLGGLCKENENTETSLCNRGFLRIFGLMYLEIQFDLVVDVHTPLAHVLCTQTNTRKRRGNKKPKGNRSGQIFRSLFWRFWIFFNLTSNKNLF